MSESIKSRKRLELTPKVGIGPVKLGMSREEVVRVMAEELRESVVTANGMDYFISNGLQVEYTDGHASFIGVSNLFPDGYEVFHQGINLFDLEADALIKYFEQFDEFDSEHSLFPNIIVTVYEPDLQYDYIGNHTRDVYSQIGVGNEEYLTAIRKIWELYDRK